MFRPQFAHFDIPRMFDLSVVTLCYGNSGKKIATTREQLFSFPRKAFHSFDILINVPFFIDNQLFDTCFEEVFQISDVG